MTMNHQRRRLLHVALAAAAFAPPATRACEFHSRTLRIRHPWSRASRRGDASAVVCMTFDEVLRDDRLVGVETALADGAEIDGRPPALAIPAGSTVELAEHGTVLRLVGLRQPLEAARSYPMRLLFAEGGAIDATLNIDYPSLRFG